MATKSLRIAHVLEDLLPRLADRCRERWLAIAQGVSRRGGGSPSRQHGRYVLCTSPPNRRDARRRWIEKQWPDVIKAPPSEVVALNNIHRSPGCRRLNIQSCKSSRQYILHISRRAISLSGWRLVALRPTHNVVIRHKSARL